MQERKVCIAVDQSPSSDSALRWAAKKLVQPEDQVRLLTVVPPNVRSELSSAGEFVGTSSAQPCEADPVELEASRQLLAECKQKMVAEGVRASQISTEPLVANISNSHDVGREINSYAERCGCESIVMGSRGLGASKRALMNLIGVGSVSSYVTRHAPCNVNLHKDPPNVKAAAEAAAAAK